MKKEFKPIAMKCTEEQFNAIRLILKENGLALHQITNFNFTPYLVNNIGGTAGCTSNVRTGSKDDYNRTVFEEWNQDIFLEYCGIKPEKQTNMGYKLTVPATDVLAIHKIACLPWKNIITKYLTRVDSEQNITFTEKEVDDMFKASASDQKLVLARIFGEKKKEEVDYAKLKTGSKVVIEYSGQHCNGIENIDTSKPVDIVFFNTIHYITDEGEFGIGSGIQRFVVFHQNMNFTMFRSEMSIDYITEVIEY